MTKNRVEEDHEVGHANMQKSPQASHPVRLLTHNIRYAAKDRERNERPWPERAPQLIAQLQFYTFNNGAAFICLQEVLKSQLDDILQGLNSSLALSDHSDWAYMGVGRDDGIAKGEFNPIFYQPRFWKAIECRTIWLNEQEDRPGLGWDAVCNRLVTIGRFEEISCGRQLVLICTHLDHMGTESRKQSARILIREVEKYYFGTPLHGIVPVLLAGDFNSPPQDEAYIILNADKSPMQDVQTLVPKKKRYGCEKTYTGFIPDAKYTGRIDFIFMDKHSGGLVKTYAALTNEIEGLFISDHTALIADVQY